jgi:hypothetical protein
MEEYVKDRTKSVKDKQGFIFDFGKYKGVHVLEVVRDDPQYLKYVYQKAKYRLSPQIHKLIIDHAETLKQLIAEQELKEIDVF